MIHALKDVSLGDLVEALRERMTEEGTLVTWPVEVFELIRTIALIPCVDAFPVRWRDGRIEMGFIRRNTGFYKGRWWNIGGRLMVGESLSDALTRHVRETLGVDFHLVPGLGWNAPVGIFQYGPEMFSTLQDEKFGHDPSKWTIAPTYLVELEGKEFTFGATAYGGQETKELRWFALDRLPFGDDLAYGGDDTVRACAAWLGRNYLK